MAENSGGAADQKIQGTSDRHSRFVHDMGVNHCRLERSVAQQRLHLADVIAGLQEMRRKAVA